MSRLRGEGAQIIVKMSRRRLWMPPYAYQSDRRKMQRALLPFQALVNPNKVVCPCYTDMTFVKNVHFANWGRIFPAIAFKSQLKCVFLNVSQV